MQFLSQQVALSKPPVPVSRNAASGFDGHAEMPAKGFREDSPPARDGVRLPEEVEDPDPLPVVYCTVNAVAVANPSRIQVRNFVPGGGLTVSKATGIPVSMTSPAQAVAAIHFDSRATNSRTGLRGSSGRASRYRRRRGARRRHHSGPHRIRLRKPWRSASIGTGLAENGGDFVKDAQFRLLLTQAPGFRRHAFLERAVRHLQMLSHFVETLRQTAEFIVISTRTRTPRSFSPMRRMPACSI